MALQQSVQRISLLCRSKVLHPNNFRLISMSVVHNNPLDPVQQIFVDQVAAYKKLSTQQGGGAVDAGPEYQQQKQDAINRLKKVYNIDDPTKFPVFKFEEPDFSQDDI
uniref:ATP synthase peripheral stalk subunit F6, mitochondrial n=1 Tax=Phallusia mammillata TaxID=59560 RepID=A0A6F9D7Z7_9ASCI|nr:ATP synthase-coupling factor 6, mitochondrial-like [Phallusia mammillata]